MNIKNEDSGERARLEEFEADVTAPTTELVDSTLIKGKALSAFRYRDFRILWSGALISNTGTWIHMAALLWYVKVLTGSDSWVGAVNFANFIPVLIFVLWAGSLADQLNRKKLIIVTQAFMMLGALALAIFTSLGGATLPVIMALTAGMGVAFVFNFPAWRAIIPDLVPREEILNGVALDAAQFNMARFIGPALGSLIISIWSVAGAFYINTASFLAVLLAIMLIRTETPPAPLVGGGTRKHILQGVKYVWRNRWATNLLAILCVTSFFGLPFVVLLPAVSRDVLHRGAMGYGLLLGFTGFGAVVAAPLVTVIHHYVDEPLIIKVAATTAGLLLISFSLSRNYWLSLALSFGLGISYLMMCASINTVLQSRVERNMRGRIMSFYILVFQGIFPIGGLVMGLISDSTSAPFSLTLGGIICSALAITLFLFPSLLKEAVSRYGPQAEPA